MAIGRYFLRNKGIQLGRLLTRSWLLARWRRQRRPKGMSTEHGESKLDHPENEPGQQADKVVLGTLPAMMFP